MTNGVNIRGNRPALIGPDHEAPLTIEVGRDAVKRALEPMAEDGHASAENAHDKLDNPECEVWGTFISVHVALLATKEAAHWGYEVERFDHVQGWQTGEPRKFLVETVVTSDA